MSRKVSNCKTNVRDEYKFTHTRTTTTTFTDGNNKRHSIQNKQVSTATQSQSYNSKPHQLSLTGPSGYDQTVSLSNSGSNQSRNRATFTQTSKTTYKGPNNQRYTYQDRDFRSSIQRESYNAPDSSRAICSRSNNYDYYYDSD